MTKKSVIFTDQDRFELLWMHYHCQVDENRAIHRSLNDLRKDIKRLEDELKARTN